MSLRDGKEKFNTAWLKVEIRGKNFIIMPHQVESPQYTGSMSKQNN